MNLREHLRRIARKGGKARAAQMTPEFRSRIAKARITRAVKPYVENDICYIPLPNGKTATVDAQDVDLVSPYTWAYSERGPQTYVLARLPNRKKIYLHRLLLNPPDSAWIDHIDGNGLNNCRSNLRLCTPSQNAMNSRRSLKNTSGFKGVSWDSKKQKWHAAITLNHKTSFIGYFETPEDAARAYDTAARAAFGEFAKPNFGEDNTANARSDDA